MEAEGRSCTSALAACGIAMLCHAILTDKDSIQGCGGHILKMVYSPVGCCGAGPALGGEWGMGSGLHV
jgi:hypothetical protein